MRPYTPAPQNAAANRIRERYLHQLGLQRGAGSGAPAPPASPPGRVVVVSGLPSLPEDRTAAAGHVLDARDFSDPGSDAGQVSAASAGGAPLAALALAYPAALRGLRLPPPAAAAPPPHDRNTLPFALWSKPAAAAAAGPGPADHESVSSAGTCTTTESSLTSNAVMLSRDWGAVPRSTSAAHEGGESPASATPVGVYFQCGHPRLLGGAPAPAAAHAAPCAAASSLAHALCRFNLDSDCEASVMSNPLHVDGDDAHAPMDEDDDGLSLDDTASRTSLNSRASAGRAAPAPPAGPARGRRGARLKKKSSKMRRLLDRAAAHEGLRRMGDDRSRQRRAELVHSQRRADVPTEAASGLASAMTAADGAAPRPSEGPCGGPLLHVRHAAGGGSAAGPRPGAAGREDAAPVPPATTYDLARTPTSSNCTDLRRLQAQLRAQLLGEASVPERSPYALPAGLHVSRVPAGGREGRAPGGGGGAAPLGVCPRLASRVPTPPPALAAAGARDARRPPSERAPEAAGPERADLREADPSACPLHHLNHQATVDDIMEVAMTLSKFGERTSGSIPRIR